MVTGPNAKPENQDTVEEADKEAAYEEFMANQDSASSKKLDESEYEQTRQQYDA